VEMLKVYRRRLSAFAHRGNQQGDREKEGVGHIAGCNFVAAAPAPHPQTISANSTRPPRQLNFYNAVQRQLMAFFPLLMLQL